MKKINICIIGARSCSSGSLINLLSQHPHANIKMLISDSEEEEIEKAHPFLRSVISAKIEKYDPEKTPEKIIKNCDAVFLHKNHGDYHEQTADLIDLSLKMKKDVKFIDLSADFRLKDKNLYDEWYKFSHKREDLLPKAVYGLTELYRDKIKDATLIANPGCYPTAVLLALAPLLKNNLIDINSDYGIYIHAISGFSGAGKNSNANSAFKTSGNIIPYKVGHVHQHVPEIEQEISNILHKKVEVTFAPHMADFKFGILTTNYVKLKKQYTAEDIYSLYEKEYNKEPFIRLVKEYPEIVNVVGSNFCDIGFSMDKRTKLCIVMSVIDNVIKGASGQAIQNMNLMYGFDEVEGLPYSKGLKEIPK